MSLIVVRLSPEGVMQYWDELGLKIVEALPPYVRYTPNVLINIQEKLLLGTMQCWAVVEDETLYAVATTYIAKEPISEVKNLMLYTITGLVGAPIEIWRLGMDKLRAFAKARDCENIIAYSSQNKIVNLSTRLGADTSVSLIQFRVEE